MLDTGTRYFSCFLPRCLRARLRPTDIGIAPVPREKCDGEREQAKD
jgi:hypothetical protein